MTTLSPAGLTIPGVTHHQITSNGVRLHYVLAGQTGSPILLVHGFPESWWAFRKLIPQLATKHRVIAVDLRGFGDSNADADTCGSVASAEDLHEIICQLGFGPVHLVSQDIGGGTAFRLATAHPTDVLSFTAIEMGLAGFGLEMLGDITHGGAWHIGVLAAPGIPELLLVGREREFLGKYAFPSMTAVQGAITDDDIAEFARCYARPNGWRGAAGLYRSMLEEGEEFRALARSPGLQVPVLAIDAGGGPFTSTTVKSVASSPVTTVTLEGIGHYAVQEAPETVAAAILGFVDEIEAA